MERLTIPDKPIDGGMRRAIIDCRAVKEQAMTIYWRLKAYEDTGLEPLWIPITERLPEVGKPVVITLRDRNVSIGTWHGHRWGTALCYNNDVLAWMPLPEPYRPVN